MRALRGGLTEAPSGAWGEAWRNPSGYIRGMASNGDDPDLPRLEPLDEDEEAEIEVARREYERRTGRRPAPDEGDPRELLRRLEGVDLDEDEE